MAPEARIQNLTCELMARAAEVDRANRALYAAARQLNIATQQANGRAA